MFAFYFAVLSAITPPVALAVYAAAGLAKSNLWKTGWAAMKIGAAGFIVPFMFVYEPALLMIGDWPNIIWRFILSCVRHRPAGGGPARLSFSRHAALGKGYLDLRCIPARGARVLGGHRGAWNPRWIARHTVPKLAVDGTGVGWSGRRQTAIRQERMTARKKPEDLRSHRWFGVEDLRSFGHRSRMRQIGYDADDWRGKPVIGIINTWSDINACHAHLRARAEDVKRGVLQAGGFPLELPAISLAEPFVKPTTMLYRNFLAMETEELLRSHPIDGAVLLGGCDKTTPGPDHGRDLHGPAGDLLSGGADAARQLARADAGLRAPTSGNTGTRSAPARSPRRTGPISRTASPARSAPA